MVDSMITPQAPSTTLEAATARPIFGSRRLRVIVRRAGKGFGEQPSPKVEKKVKLKPQVDAEIERKEVSTSSRPSSALPSPGTILEVPEAVNQRLLNRMLIFSLGPVFLGFLSLPLLAYIQVVLKVDLPTGTAFAVSGLCFGAGLLGITYGILSASWDENKEGSGLGLEEFKSNAAPIFDKIKRSQK